MKFLLLIGAALFLISRNSNADTGGPSVSTPSAPPDHGTSRVIHPGAPKGQNPAYDFGPNGVAGDQGFGLDPYASAEDETVAEGENAQRDILDRILRSGQ